MKFNDMVRSLQGHKNNTDYSKMNKSDDFYCERCDRRVSEDNIYDTNRGYICGDCFDELESNGDNVHERASTRKMKKSSDTCMFCGVTSDAVLEVHVFGDYYPMCEDCMWENTDNCEVCDETMFVKDLNETSEGLVCDDCLDKIQQDKEVSVYYRPTNKAKKSIDGECDVCGNNTKLMHTDVGDLCYDCLEDVEHCSECGKVDFKDYMDIVNDQFVCRDCVGKR